MVKDVDDWYRVDLTAANNSSGNTEVWCYVYPVPWIVDGSNVGYIYAWGAQLVEGSVPGDYTRTIAGNTRGGHLVLSNVSGSFIDTELLSFIGAGDGFNSGFSAGFG